MLKPVSAGVRYFRYLSVETATQTLHRLTSYEPGREWDEPVDDPRIVQDLEVNDLARFPWFFKRYAAPLPGCRSPVNCLPPPASAVAVLAGTADVARAEPDLPHLSRLLHLSAGVVRTTERPYGTYLFRAAGSAGGRFPLELYVAVPERHRCPPACTGTTRSSTRSCRSGRRRAAARPPRRHRHPVAHRLALPRARLPAHLLGRRHDAGPAAGAGRLRRPAAGLYTRFPDAEVAALVGADGVHELPGGGRRPR